MRYIMVDWQGRQVGNTEASAQPLLTMAEQLNERNDLVIWSLDDQLVRRVVCVCSPAPYDTIPVHRV